MADKRDVLRERDRGMHGRQEGCVERKGQGDAWQTRGMCRDKGGGKKEGDT